MTDNNPKDIFNEAFAYLKAGEIATATARFQHVIDHSSFYGPLAARIAQQRILWYCIPLDAILRRMAETRLPVDICDVIPELTISDNRYQDSDDVKPIVGAVEEQLAKMSNCVRVGQSCWVNRSVLTSLANKVILNLNQTVDPIALSEVYRRAWIDFCNTHPGFPDHISEAALSGILQEHHVKILGNRFVIPEKFIEESLNRFADLINKIDGPVFLTEIINQLLPDLILGSPENIQLFVDFLRLNLDSRFVQLSPGQYITNVLLKFNSEPFDTVFILEELPQSLETLIKSCYPTLDVDHLDNDFRRQVITQLNNNRNLVRIDNSTWFSKQRFEDLQIRVIQMLRDADTALSTDHFVKQFAPAAYTSRQRSQFGDLVYAALKSGSQVVAVGYDYWLHQSTLPSLLDLAYKLLLESGKKLTTQQIVTEIMGIKSAGTKFFQSDNIFEKYLRQDPRFNLTDRYPSRWQAVRPSQLDNDAVYQLLSASSQPLTLAQIASKLNQPKPQFDLAEDERFKELTPGLWGLSSWVWLNDLAYEYLLAQGKHLHANTITGLLCQEHGYRQQQAFFLPQNDPRFAQDAINRWFCRYTLKPEDLERLLGELDRYAGAGQKLDILFNNILKMHPEVTNAAEVLPADDRFIELDQLWYSRNAAFYSLGEEDVEEIYQYFCRLPEDSPAIPLRDVGMNPLGWDGRLTDLVDWIGRDERFVEVHPGFWALSNWSAPSFERIHHGGISAHERERREDSAADELVQLPEKLTKRKRKREAGRKTEIDKKIYHPLSQMDILHGNLRITGAMKVWIPAEVRTIRIVDEEKREMVAYVDDDHTILNIRNWLDERGLTYGDKIAIQPGKESDVLVVTPYGKRDERVYQEAQAHQDIENLIAQAREVGKPFHDLMIEVMESFGAPMYREDIFQLVDYQRTAARSTIFETLSLTECPYEELRYFVPHGKGYWSFDRQRKEAFDMKMNELADANKTLLGRVAELEEQLEVRGENSEGAAELQERIRELEGEQIMFQVEKNGLEEQVGALEKEKAKAEQEQERLANELGKLQVQLGELAETKSSAVAEMEALQAERQRLIEQEAKTREEMEQAREALAAAEGQTEGQIKALQAELEALQTVSDKEKEGFKLETEKLQEEISQLTTRLKETEATAQIDVADYKGLIAQLKQQVSDLQVELNNSHADAKALHSRDMDLTVDLQAEIYRLKNELEESRAEKDIFIQNAAEHAAEQEKMQEQIARLEEQVQKLQYELEQSHANAEADRLKAQDQITSLSGQTNNLNQEVNTRNQRLTEALEQLSSEQANKQELQLLYEQVQSQFQDFQAQAGEQSQKLKEQMLELNAALDERAARITELETSFESLKSEFEMAEVNASKGVESAQTQLATAQEQLAALTSRYEQQAKKYDALKARLTQINRALATPMGRIFTRLQRLS